METTKTKYASALFSIALEKNVVQEYLNESKSLLKVFLENEKFLDVLASPFLPLDQRINKVDDIFKDKYCIDIVNFLKVIIKNNRAKLINDILKEFISLANDNLNVIEGIVYSSVKLNEKEIKIIEDCVKKVEKKKIELTNIVNASLIGGIKVVVKDRIYDGSLLFKLESMKESILKGGE